MGATFIAAELIIFKLFLNMKMKLSTSKVFFNERIGRIILAPINLYLDITSTNRIYTRFKKYLSAVEGQFYIIL